jgi:hypothetical protein
MPAGKTPPCRLASYRLDIFADDSAKEFSILLRRVITIDPTTLTQSRFAGRAVHLGCDCITQRTVE